MKDKKEKKTNNLKMAQSEVIEFMDYLVKKYKLRPVELVGMLECTKQTYINIVLGIRPLPKLPAKKNAEVDYIG